MSTTDRIRGEQKLIAERIRTARKRAGLTVRDAAGALHVAERTYSRWESGKTAAFLPHLDQVADVLGVTRDDLAGEPAIQPYVERLTIAEHEVAELRAELTSLRRFVDEIALRVIDGRAS